MMRYLLMLLPLVLGSYQLPAASFQHGRTLSDWPLAAGSRQLFARPSAADTLELAINAVPGMKFDRVRFQVKPETPVKMVFTNTDQQDDMDHNLVVTRPGARERVVVAAMQATPAEQYVPKSEEVLVFTPLLKQGGSYVLRFTAPSEPGAYPYVCTFPGHGYVMYGVMYVGMEMPPLAQDENVPAGQRATVDLADTGRVPGLSYGTTFPAISRTFMPESGPASIAVGLEGGHSFNFDAGVSYLRYAWTGGFVDNVKHWRGNGNAYADVVGEIYYRNAVGFPLRVGARDSAQDVRFLGYRLVEGGLPEFRYAVDGAEVREVIRAGDGGVGLHRTFHVRTTEPVRLLTEPDAGVRFQSSAGRWRGAVLELTPEEARRFTITMTPTAGGAR